MIDYGTQRSTVKPGEVEILETKIFLYSDITEVTEEGTDDEPGFSGYEFGLVEYTKDEYIQLQAERNDALETELENTQLALCEVYELLA